MPVNMLYIKLSLENHRIETWNNNLLVSRRVGASRNVGTDVSLLNSFFFEVNFLLLNIQRVLFLFLLALPIHIRCIFTNVKWFYLNNMMLFLNSFFM